ncbi:hypothetical protein V7087_27500 [Neobacillus niacini]
MKIKEFLNNAITKGMLIGVLVMALFFGVKNVLAKKRHMQLTSTQPLLLG